MCKGRKKERKEYIVPRVWKLSIASAKPLARTARRSAVGLRIEVDMGFSVQQHGKLFPFPFTLLPSFMPDPQNNGGPMADIPLIKFCPSIFGMVNIGRNDIVHRSDNEVIRNDA